MFARHSPKNKGKYGSPKLCFSASLVHVWKAGCFQRNGKTSYHSVLLAADRAGFGHFKAPCRLNKLETENTGMRKKYVHANTLHSGWSQVPSAFDATPGLHSSLKAPDWSPTSSCCCSEAELIQLAAREPRDRTWHRGHRASWLKPVLLLRPYFLP